MLRIRTLLITVCLPWLLLLLHSSVTAAEYQVGDEYTEAVARIKNNDQVQRAMDHIMELEPQSLRDLIELTEIQAAPFNEERRAARYAEMLRAAGLEDVVMDEVGNAIGRRPGNSGERVIAYTAHLDTVFPEETDVSVRFEGERMYAPGISDNTRGLITVLTVLRAMEYADIETAADIWFIGNVGEEGLGDLSGMKHLFREGADPIDTMIAVDGGRSSRIVFGGVGSHRYRVTYHGPGGHSWGAFGLANPQHALGRAIALFDQNAPSVTREGEKTSYNIGRIGGGTSINAIPFEAWMEVDMRSGRQDKLDEIDAVFQAAVQLALEQENLERDDGPELSVDIERVGTRPAAQGDADWQVVQHALAATLAFGITPELTISSTDANLPISIGVPAITMSRGGEGGNSHSLNEWWENVDGHVGIQIGLVSLLAEAGLVE